MLYVSDAPATVLRVQENVRSITIRSLRLEVTGVNVVVATGAKANNVWIEFVNHVLVVVDAAVDASVQIVVKVQLVFMSFTTADAMRFVQLIVVAVLAHAWPVSLNDGQNVKLAPTVCHALSFSSDAMRTVSENV